MHCLCACLSFYFHCVRLLFRSHQVQVVLYLILSQRFCRSDYLFCVAIYQNPPPSLLPSSYYSQVFESFPRLSLSTDGLVSIYLPIYFYFILFQFFCLSLIGAAQWKGRPVRQHTNHAPGKVPTCFSQALVWRFVDVVVQVEKAGSVRCLRKVKGAKKTQDLNIEKKTTSIQLHHFKLGLVFPLLHLAGLGVQVVKAKWSAVSSCSMLKMHSVWFPEAIPLLLDLKLFHLRATVNETGLDHSHHRWFKLGQKVLFKSHFRYFIEGTSSFSVFCFFFSRESRLSHWFDWKDQVQCVVQCQRGRLIFLLLALVLQHQPDTSVPNKNRPISAVTFLSPL